MNEQEHMTNEELFDIMKRHVRRAFNAGFKSGMLPASQEHPEVMRLMGWGEFCKTKLCRKCGGTFRDAFRHYCD
jgi:hypothetical protein